MAKLKNLNCDKTQKNKLWQNLKDQIMTKLKNSNCAKLKKLNCDNSKTQIVIVIKMTVVTEVVIMTSFRKKHLNTLTTDHSQGSFSQFLRCFQKRYFIRSWGFLRCIQCIKTLLLSYQNQLSHNFSDFSS